MDLIFVIEKDLCIDCSNCETECQARHGNGRIRRGTSEHHIGVEVPQVCRQCKTPNCVTGCPREAIKVVKDVVVINDRCIGCGKCARLCPYESIFLYSKESKQSHSSAESGKGKRRAEKCTLCKGFPDQACTENCPTGALKRVSIREWAASPGKDRKTVLALALLLAPLLLFFTFGIALQVFEGPSETIPHVMSITAAALFVGSLLYTIRRRTKCLAFGKLRHWLWAHIFFSSIGFVLVIFHISGKIGFNEPTFAFSLLLILVVTGIFHRFIYPQRPRPAVLAEFSRQKLNDMIENLREIAPLEQAMRGRSPEPEEDVGKDALTGEESTPTVNPHGQTLPRETSMKVISEDRAYRLFEVSRLSADVEHLAYWETLLRKIDYLSHLTCKLHKWLAITFIALLILHVILVFLTGTVKIF